jgi:ABC-type lipoprotein export system ATPase subunit
VAWVGPSGSGKSTLLNLIGTLDKPTSGSIQVAGQEVSGLDRAASANFRLKHIGFVFQDFRLIDYLDVRENIRLPWRLNAALEFTGEVDARLRELAAALQREEKLDTPIDELSQGEQQRTAIGRALLPSPGLILADEPTGNLDSATEAEIIRLLEELNAEGRTIIMVTHEPEVAEHDVCVRPPSFQQKVRLLDVAVDYLCAENRCVFISSALRQSVR